MWPPPLLLSADAASQEFNWSQGRYILGRDVWKAFKLPGSPPTPVGIGNNQPNPFKAASRTRWSVYLVAVLLGFLFMMLRTITVPRPFFQHDWSYKEYEASRVQTIPVTVPPGKHNLTITLSAPALRERWAYFPVSLINEKSQEIVDTDFSLYHESGRDSDGPWSAAQVRDSRRLAGVSGGNYLLRIEPQSNVQAKNTPEGSGIEKSFPAAVFGYSVKIERGHPMWGYFWMVVVLGLLPPLWSLWRSSSFETSRWSESDHAPVSGFDLND